MDELDLLIDLHLAGARQGPGGDDETRLAISLSGLSQQTDLLVADIGCGTGASTLVLAESLDARVVGVDLLAPFLHRLEAETTARGLAGRVAAVAASMDALPFEAGSLDAIWSEGAIYQLGFEQGIEGWRSLLKPGGVLAVSELTWLTAERPAELEEHWNREYPEVATAAHKLGQLERAGYSPIGYFPLPPRCWLDHYYCPLQERFAAFLDRHRGVPAAQDVVDAERHEIDLYERHQRHVSYGFYIARRTDD